MVVVETGEARDTEERKRYEGEKLERNSRSVPQQISEPDAVRRKILTPEVPHRRRWGRRVNIDHTKRTQGLAIQMRRINATSS